MNIKVDTREIKKAAKWMSDIGRKQMPYAMMLTLNDVKDRGQDALTTEMLRKLDRPTPFTLNAFDKSYSTRATKRNLRSLILVKQIQAEYLYDMFFGGTENKKHIVPGKEAKLNQYGNLPRNASKRKRTFTIVSNGTPIRLQRAGKGKTSKTKVIGIFPSRRSYRSRIDYEGTITRAVDRWMQWHWNKNFERALLTAR